MKKSRLAGAPEWKQLMRLGEELISQPDAAAQSRLIVHTIAGLLDCQARLWLAKPVYPLPGQPPVEVIPGAKAPQLVYDALSEEKTLCESVDAVFSGTSCDENHPAKALAIPLISQNHILAVLFVERLEGNGFQKEELDLLEAFTAHAALALRVSQQVTLKNWRSDQLALVRKVSAQTANIPDLDELCVRITSLIKQSFDYYEVAIFTLEAGQEELYFRASARQSLQSEKPPAYHVKLGEGLIGLVAQTGNEIVAPDVDLEPRYRYVDTLPETQSEVALPIKLEERILGVLDVQSDRQDAFHEADVLVLQALVDNIALAVEGVRLYGSMKHRAEQISAVVEVSHTLTSILDLTRLQDEVVRVIQTRFGFTHVHLYTVHPGRRKIFYVAGSGERSQAMREQEINFDLDDPHGIIPWVARNNQVRIANDVSQDPLYQPGGLAPKNTQSEMTLPLEFGGEVMALLDIQSDQLNAFDQEDQFLLEAVTASTAIAFHNATLYTTEQWRRQVGDSFRDVANLLSANVSLERLLDTILLELERNLPCDASAIWLIDDAAAPDPDSGYGLRLAAVRGVSQEVLVEAREKFGEARNWLARTLLSDEPTIRQPADPTGPLGAALNLPPEYSSIAVPLRIGDRPMGVLTLAHHTPDRYGSETRLMTTSFAGYAAAAIQNARLFAEAQEQAWVSTILLQVADACQSIASADELYSTMVRLTRLLVGIKKCGVFVWDEKDQTFILKAWHGLERQPLKREFKEIEAPAFARLNAERTTIYIEDAAAELNIPAAAVSQDNGTLVLLPLMAHDLLLGAFMVAHQPDVSRLSGQVFEQQVLSVLQGIAHQAAMALENLRLVEARQEEAYVTAVLLQVAQAVVSQSELTDILDTIANLMPILVGIDACFIFLWDPERKQFVTAQAFTGSRQADKAMIGISYSPGEFILLDCVRQNDTPYFSLLAEPDMQPENWAHLECYPIDQLGYFYGSVGDQWLLAFPLAARGELLGVLLAREAGLVPALQERRLEIINGIAQQAALAIQNERFKNQNLEQERLEREFQLARQIQTTFLPNSLPVLQGWEVAARWQPARQVGGDFYDIFNLGKDRFGLAIADVSDKGMPAALYMTVARTLIRAYARGAHSPAAVLEKVNAPMVRDTPNSMFVTAVFAMLWPGTGELVFSSAGHNRPLIVRACSGFVEQLPLGGMALGVYENMSLEDHKLTLNPTDVLLFYTDGVTESFSPTGEAFGEERLKTLLADNCGMPLDELVDVLENSLVEWRAGAPPSDDTTLLVIRRLAD